MLSMIVLVYGCTTVWLWFIISRFRFFTIEGLYLQTQLKLHFLNRGVVIFLLVSVLYLSYYVQYIVGRVALLFFNIRLWYKISGFLKRDLVGYGLEGYLQLNFKN